MWMCECVYTWMCVCLNVCMCVCVCMYVCLCLWVCVRASEPRLQVSQSIDSIIIRWLRWKKNATQIVRKSKPSQLHEWDHVATARIPVDRFEHHTMIAMKIKCFANYSKIETITAARVGSCRSCKYPSRSIRSSYDECDENKILRTLFENRNHHGCTSGIMSQLQVSQSIDSIVIRWVRWK